MRMNEFIKELYGLAGLLEPFTHIPNSKSLKWNGKEYVKAENNLFDPIALVWWTKLTTIAEMINAQELLLSSEQLAYIEHQIFGGMGSFSDFMFGVDKFGSEAVIANKKLDEVRKKIFIMLKE